MSKLYVVAEVVTETRFRIRTGHARLFIKPDAAHDELGRFETMAGSNNTGLGVYEISTRRIRRIDNGET